LCPAGAPVHLESKPRRIFDEIAELLLDEPDREAVGIRKTLEREATLIDRANLIAKDPYGDPKIYRPALPKVGRT
jgi:hypothetical protein